MGRPEAYQYWNILEEHVGDASAIFSGKMVYPRQVEVQLPSDHRKPCNFDCHYCQGLKFIKDLGRWETDGLRLLDQLRGKIPYFIYGGAYTEPILNPYLMAYLGVTKKHGSHFGIHTNGSVLKQLEDTQGWLTEACALATDRGDYISVSLDAGTMESHSKTKGLSKDWFTEIIEGIRAAVKIRDESNAKGPAIRICYLMNEHNSSKREIEKIVSIAKNIGVDSLRFSIPYAVYTLPFDLVRIYKKNIEDRYDSTYYERVKPYLSDGKPFIFYLSPKHQSIERYTFDQCVYGYYQICLGADGYVYRCTAIATPTFKDLRLGKISDNLNDLERMILANQNPAFSCEECFKRNGRCNRIALELNSAWRDIGS